MAGRVTQSYVSVLSGFEGAIDVEASNSLGFVQTDEIAEFFDVLAQTFLTETTEHNHVNRDILQTFLSDIAGHHHQINIIQYLGFTPVQPFNIGQGLGLVDFANIVVDETVSNEFAWTQEVLQVHPTSNEFGFTETVVRSFIQRLRDRMTFTQDPDTSGSEYGRDEQQMALRQHVAYVIENAPCREKDYAPSIGSSDDPEFEAPSPDPPVIAAGDMTLFHPFGAPTLVLTLKPPSFGDSTEVVFQRVDTLTRGGQRIIFNDPTWPKAEILQLTVAGLSGEKVDEFIAFVNTSLGEDIGLVDWEGGAFKLVIIAPDTDIVETAAGFTITLRMQGERLS